MEPDTNLRSREPEDSLLYEQPERRTHKDRYWLHLLLFVVTFVTTVYSGGVWASRILRYQEMGGWWFMPDGLRFAVALLLFLTVHEFGHYIAARRHGIGTSLPYYIPAPPVMTFGTLGAVIRIRDPIPTLRKLFDVGAAGPLAGFVIAFGVLIYAFVTLPPPTYLLDLPGHEQVKEYIQQYGTYPDQMPPVSPELVGTVPVFGQTLLYWLVSQFFTDVPPMYEMYHYPFLLAGWLGLFFTALNLLPVGQLDGGHIVYALVGRKWHGRIARAFMVFLLISGSIGFAEELAPQLGEYSALLGELSWFVLAAILYFFLHRVFQGDHRFIAPALLGIIAATIVLRVLGWADRLGWTGWFIFGLLLVLIVKIDHPPVMRAQPLTPRRKVLGVVCIAIFVLCFSIQPVYFR